MEQATSNNEVLYHGCAVPTVNDITAVEERPDSPDARELLGELDTYLQSFPYPPESQHAFSVEKLLQENVAFFVTRVDGRPAGCGGVKLYEGYGEVKRMYVRPAYRGRGLGKDMMNRLSDYSRARRRDVLRLETGIYQAEAISLYERCGFQRRPPFGEYNEDPMSIYFELKLA